MSTGTGPGSPVAIVGMAAVMPGAGTLEAYWRNLVDGVDSITDVPPHRWDQQFYDPQLAHRADRLYCRRGGFIDDFATFEPLKFGIPPTSIAGIEPDQLIALQVAAAAIDDAGGPQRLPDRDRIGVFIGRGGVLNPAASRYALRIQMPTQVVQVLRDLIPDLEEDRLDLIRKRFDEIFGPFQPENAIGLVPNLAASRLANRLNLRGPAYTLDAACASSLIAVDQAVTELNNGRLDAVLAGGVHHSHDITYWSVFSQLRALSRRGESRPFDQAADGLLIGEGTGIVVLKRLSDAVRDGDRIYAVVRGCGVSSDGRSASMFNPATPGQVLAIHRAWQAAGLDPTAPDALGLLEAHGTATPTGDAAELTTVAEAFGPDRGGPRPVIGSVKSMIGHTQPAAGIAGLIKVVLAVSRGVLLPTLHCDNPRPELERTRFAPIATAQPWQCDGPRRAGVNAFGFGGINAHVIVEEFADAMVARHRPAQPGAPAAALAAPGPAGSVSTVSVTVAEPDQVLWLAAADPAGMARLLDRDDQAVRALGDVRAPDRGLVRPAARPQNGAGSNGHGPNGHGPNGAGRPGADGRCRLGIVDPTDKRLATARRVVARGQAWRGGRDIWFSPDPLLAGAAPGRLAFVFPGLEAEFAPRTDDIEAHFGLPGRQWSAADLGRHGAGVIETGKLLDQALRRMGVVPDTVAGHSIGEWTAAATTGQISTTTMDEFLAAFNAETVEVPGYAFAAIGASAARITVKLAGYPGVVLSHDNAPAQCVVNGPQAQVERLVEALRGENILCQTLPFRSVFHTPAFGSGLRSIGEALRSWKVHPSRVPVWSATIAAPFPTDEAQVTELFIRHMMEPVRFRQTVAALYDAGVRVFLQVGVGQLASLIDDNLRDRPHLAIPVNVSHRGGLDQLRRVATALWVEGAAPDLGALDAPAGRRPAAGPTTRPGPADRPGPTTTRPGSADRPGSVVRLDLGGGLVRMGPGASELLALPARTAHPAYAEAARPGPAAPPAHPAATPAHPAAPPSRSAAAAGRPAATPAQPATATPQPQPQVTAPHPADGSGTLAALTALQRLAGQSSAAAELAALLRDTADGAATVMAATRSRPARPGSPPIGPTRTGGRPPRPPVHQPPTAAGQLPPGTSVSSGNGRNGSSGSDHDGSSGNGRTGGQPVVHRTVLRVSLETMPYLIDHCFFFQPDDWPDPQDRWPVVPATTVVQHMMDAAEQAAPGMRAVGVRDARFNRWVIAAPAQDVEITVRPVGPNQFTVSFGTYARATVDVAVEYPANPPAVFGYDPATERPPQVSAEQMYAERLMFHGPVFRGVSAVHALGDMHVRGEITAPRPPGALLDNSLQVVGNWLFTTQPLRTVALPVRFHHIQFFGPPPPVGKVFESISVIRSIDEAELIADTQIIDGDRVWAQIEGVVDRRFDSHPSAKLAERFPARYSMSTLQPEGWTMVFDYWADLVTRSMSARFILGTSAYAEYERQPAATRRHWLLGRIAAKDAIRFRQWEDGQRDIFPIELTIQSDPDGRSRVDLRPGRGLRDCDISLGHCAEVGVAIARPRVPGTPPGAPGVGIDVAELIDHPDSAARPVLAPGEAALLDSLASSTGEPRRLWLARFQVARQAVAKAEGAGPDGQPRRCTVVAAAPAALTVEVAGRAYQVEYREVSNPEGLPPRRYVVGWTWGPQPAPAASRS